MRGTSNHSIQFIRRRRFLIVLPLLTVPFVTGLLWALQSFSKEEKKTAIVKGQHGLNPELPGAHLKEDGDADKMGIYDEAEIDSVKRGARIRSESFYPAKPAVGASDSNEEKVHRKLHELNSVLHTVPGIVTLPMEKRASLATVDRPAGADLDRLEQRLRQMQGEKEDNPEMAEMNEVLDKLIRVQHPELLRDSLRERFERTRAEALPVDRVPEEGSVSLLAQQASRAQVVTGSSNQFYELSDSVAQEVSGNLLEALVPASQVLVNGATVKLELMHDVLIRGITVPAGTALYGLAALNNERLNIGIRSIRQGDHILPVDLQVYDQDGLEGIFIPGAISRDAVKQSADQGLNALGPGAYDLSIGSQAASAGIQLAKNMMSRKVKLVRVTVGAGYRVWLKDGKQH